MIWQVQRPKAAHVQEGGPERSSRPNSDLGGFIHKTRTLGKLLQNQLISWQRWHRNRIVERGLYLVLSNYEQGNRSENSKSTAQMKTRNTERRRSTHFMHVSLERCNYSFCESQPLSKTKEIDCSWIARTKAPLSSHPPPTSKHDPLPPRILHNPRNLLLTLPTCHLPHQPQTGIQPTTNASTRHDPQPPLPNLINNEPLL